MLSLYVFSLITWLRSRIANKDSGEVSIEYVLVGGLAGAAIILAMVTFSGDLGEWFTELGTKIGGVFD